MKQVVIAIFSIAMVVADPPDPNCAPPFLPKNASFVDCCQMKVEMIPADVLDKCAAQFPKPSMPPPPPADGKPPGHPGQGCCISECALKELKVLVDGKIDKNAAIAQLTAKDPSLKSIVEPAVTFCMEKAASMPAPPSLPPNSCGFLPMFMIGCTYGQLMKNCTSQLVPGKDECVKLSEFAKKCDWVNPMQMKKD